MKGCRPLTPKEVEVLAKSFAGKFANRDKAIFVLGTKSGFRISELLSLRVEDVFQAGRMVDRIYVCRQNMKKKVEGRSVILHQDARRALRTWIKDLLMLGL